MGKILIEKILRSCPDVAAVYILIRPKKGKEAAQRLEDFFSCPVFIFYLLHTNFFIYIYLLR